MLSNHARKLRRQSRAHEGALPLANLRAHQGALPLIELKDFEIVKVHFVTRGTRVGKHTGLSGVRGMFSHNRRDTQVL